MSAPAPRVLVVGGTGTVGRIVLEHLSRRGVHVRAMVRDPAVARGVVPPGVELVAGDLTAPATLAPALAGIDVAFLATAVTPQLAAQERAFVDAAVAARLGRLVNLSMFGAALAPTAPIYAWHLESERHLAASGLPATVLRPAVFMSNFVWDAPAIRDGRIHSVFGSSRMAFVDPADVAELAVVALIDPASVGASIEIGGPAALSYDDVAAGFAAELGRPVVHRATDVATLRGAGLPDWVVGSLAVTADLLRDRRFAPTDAAIRRLLGRPGGTLARWIRAHRAAFTP